MKVIKGEPWACGGCGFRCDAIGTLVGEEGVPPTDGDMNVCLNCGARYLMRNGHWQLITAADLSQLPLKVRHELERIEALRRLVVKDDLSFNQGL
jgi:hypothetical protein